jgi:hypothetical protein
VGQPKASRLFGNFFKFPVMWLTKKKKMVEEAKWWYLLHWCVLVWSLADVAAGPAESLERHLHLPLA